MYRKEKKGNRKINFRIPGPNASGFFMGLAVLRFSWNNGVHLSIHPFETGCRTNKYMKLGHPIKKVVLNDFDFEV
jgi:hypothetical protein